MNSTSSSPEELLFYKIEFILQVYGGLLIFVGIPANFICGIVMGSDITNHSSTRLLMALLAAVDSAVLMTALLRYWMIETFKIDIRSLNALSCLMHTFLVAVFTDAAIATLCALATERFLVVAFPYKSKRWVNFKNCVITIMIIFVVLISKNSFNLYFMELKPSNITLSIPNVKKTSSIIRPKCLPKTHLLHYVIIFSKVDLITYSVLPYFILFSTNTYIFIILRRQNQLLKSHSNSQNNKKRRNNRGRQSRNIIKILTALSIVHLITTVPGTIYNFIAQFFPIKLRNVSYLNRRLITDGLMMLMFTNNATNFLAYLISSDSFRQRITVMFTCSTKSTSKSRTICTEMITVQEKNNENLDPTEEASKLTFS